MQEQFFKRFQGVNEKDPFETITIIQHKGNVDEYTYEWEALATRVLKLTNEQCLQTYVRGLKQYLRDELEMHNITTMEKERRKEKFIENKFKRSSHTSFNKFYSRRKPPQAEYVGTSNVCHYI